jgi:hypothetical protein
MTYHIHPDNYNPEELIEFKRMAALDVKIAILSDLIEPVQALPESDIKADLEEKIIYKIGRLVDKI